MGFQIEVNTGEAGPVVLKGCPDGTVAFCKWQEVKDRNTKEVKPVLVEFKWYASIEQAFQKVARMRVCSASANDIKGLVEAIRAIRDDIKKEMGAN